jgi:hypothetical protein
VNTVQRWRSRRDTYRPSGAPIRTALYDVALIPDDTTAQAFVESHHYSGTYPAARVRVGLYRQDVLMGVAVFSHPCSNRVLTNVFPSLAPREAVELGRFVLLDEVPANGETWMLARCFDLLRAQGIRGVVSFSDPVPRTDASGRRLFAGHVGTIYQAHNARYLGRSYARTLHLLPDATVFSHRAAQKIRSGHRGWRYAAGKLVAFGAEQLPADADQEGRVAWLHHWTARLTRRLRHPGNYRYAWRLDRRVALAPSGPYPKQGAAS